MPDLTVSFTAPQLSRVKSALGVSTNSEVVTAIKRHLKGLVTDEALITRRKGVESAARDELNSEGWDNVG